MTQAPTLILHSNHVTNSELSTGHFSWTRPGETLTRPDLRMPTKSLTRPEPTPHMYHVSWVQHIRDANMEQYTIGALFRGKQWKIFFPCFVMFPETISSGLIFQDRYLGPTKRLQISNVSKVHSRFTVSRSKLWSLNSFHPARFRQTSQIIRSVPGVPMLTIYTVQYCFNFKSNGNRDLGQGLYGSNRRRSLSKSYYDPIYKNSRLS